MEGVVRVVGLLGAAMPGHGRYRTACRGAGFGHGGGLGHGENGEHVDQVALAEMDLCGELMIAAASACGERLSADRIDEVLRTAGRPPHGAGDRGEAPSSGRFRS